ncbi:Hypothetical predicted protein [Mytilus galloprovincialis]|uniref:Uncharacterized protein n=1 Tax=Mytilus galloprovincialis TaxID=29158 RepID=A0A8B6GCM2_MYTGA|nr:Hypothetical predicted protein [Mytilus galloprovincialis]
MKHIFQYFLTGIFPLCMTDSRKLRWKCLKITFLVLSIISAVVFCPAMLSIGLLSVFIVDVGDNGYIVAVSAIIDTCAAIEMIVAITSATYCCCCSQMLPNNQQTVVIFNPVQERVIHTVTHLQGPNVNQNGVLYPQGYQQQYYMTNSQGQMMPWQFPGQVLHGPESQQHSGMSNANPSQQPWHMQPGSEQQVNQSVNRQQKN